jgi:plasmid replication initiation protein
VFFFWRKKFGMQTVRVPVGRVPQIKHTCERRKISFIKNACNNFDKKKLKQIQKDRN